MALIEIYVNEYLGKIFYYCLKKTGKENDAAEAGVAFVLMGHGTSHTAKVSYR